MVDVQLAYININILLNRYIIQFLCNFFLWYHINDSFLYLFRDIINNVLDCVVVFYLFLYWHADVLDELAWFVIDVIALIWDVLVLAVAVLDV